MKWPFRGRPAPSPRAVGRIAATLLALPLLAPAAAVADIPATPVMTLYRFNGDAAMPYYEADAFARRGTGAPAAGTLAQGTSVIPCLVIRDGRPLTDGRGTPFVGFEIVVDARKATPASTDVFKQAVKRREALRVPNHHCDRGVRHVIDVRNLYALNKAPFFDPPGGSGRIGDGRDAQTIVRAFHESPFCAQANQRLTGRRQALAGAWDRFTREHRGRWSAAEIARARHLDYTMRTALLEGHLDRGCNAYGACERNIVALSIRNRARENCLGRQGCRAPGDFEGVASIVSQYNIWDEYLTQISGLTACYLRRDLADSDYYRKLQVMHEQNVGDVERILFGSDRDLTEIFPGTPLADLKRLAHYYHAPAMGKCFPDHGPVEYMSGAVARKGSDFALIANTRIRVDGKSGDGYRFRSFRFEETPERDLVTVRDDYPGFVVDGRKVSLRSPSGCRPYGIPAGCRLKEIGRHRKVPSWLDAGKPLEIACRIQDRGEVCDRSPRAVTTSVGGACDKEMRPVAGVK